MSNSINLSRLNELRRSSGIKIDKKGRWWHENDLFEHQRVIQVLNKGLGWINKTPSDHQASGPFNKDNLEITFSDWSGEATVTIGDQWCYVGYDITPFLVLKLKVDKQAATLVSILNTGEQLSLGPLTLFQEILYTRLRDDRLARFSPQAQAQVASWLDEDEDENMFLEYQNQKWLITHYSG